MKSRQRIGGIVSRSARGCGIALAIAIALSGCDRPIVEASRDDRAAVGSSERAARPVDAQLIAFLSKARAAHHKADFAEAEGNLEAAAEHLASILSGPIPDVTPEVAEVLADVHARMADLRSRQERFDDAVFHVELGLGYADGVSYYRGHLFEVLGVLEQRRMGVLEGEGDRASAEVARAAALDAFDEAIRIQDEVIMQALPDPVAPPPHKN